MVLVLMGVAGTGKTTVGQLLASELGWRFADGDDYHSAANVDKMRHGTPLTDADRGPWLETLRSLVSAWISSGENAILACSALKESYRDILRVSPDVHFVYLKGDAQLLRQRLAARSGHFMHEQMLTSQLESLEEPQDATVVDVAATPAEIVNKIREDLKL